jgi:hypothetical protein
MARQLHFDTIAFRHNAHLRIIVASQGDWFRLIMDFHTEPGAVVTAGDLVAHFCKADHDDVLERIHAKVRRGFPVWLDDEPIPAEDVQRALIAHDTEPA